MHDLIFCFRGPMKKHAKCHLRIEANTVVCTELADNPGVSITNFAEVLATLVCERFGLSPHKLTWIEHWPGGSTIAWKETWSTVFFDFRQKPLPEDYASANHCRPRWSFHNPRWRACDAPAGLIDQEART